MQYIRWDDHQDELLEEKMNTITEKKFSFVYGFFNGIILGFIISIAFYILSK